MIRLTIYHLTSSVNCDISFQLDISPFSLVSTMKKISQQRIDAISLMKKGFSVRKIATRLGIGSSTVVRIRIEANLSYSSIKNGRPRLLNARQESFIVRQICSEKVNNASQARKNLKNDFILEVSTQTVRNMLKKRGMKSAIKNEKTIA